MAKSIQSVPDKVCSFPQCGNRLKDGAKFCASCGTPAPGAASAPAVGASAPAVVSEHATAAVVQAAPVGQPTTFKVALPPGAQPGQVMQVPVPAGYPQTGQMAQVCAL